MVPVARAIPLVTELLDERLNVTDDVSVSVTVKVEEQFWWANALLTIWSGSAVVCGGVSNTNSE